MRISFRFFLITLLGLATIAFADPWEFRLDGVESAARNINFTSDGGYIIAGTGAMFKLSPTGSLLWSSPISGAEAKQTWDGGYVLVGNNSFMSAMIARTDSTGDTLWTRLYGRSRTRADFYNVFPAPDSCILATGYHNGSAYSPSGGNGCLVKFDQNGDTLWNRSYAYGQETRFFAAVKVSDGFLMAGRTKAVGTESDFNFVAVRTNDNGDTIWTGIYGRTGNQICNGVTVCSDGGFLLTGSTDITTGGGTTKDLYLVKISSTGAFQWEQHYGSEMLDEVGEAVAADPNGGYIVTGYAELSGVAPMVVSLMKVDSAGAAVWTSGFGTNLYNAGLAVRTLSDGSILCAGLREANFVFYGDGEAWVACTNSDGSLSTLDPAHRALPVSVALQPAYPNPFNSTTVVRYSLPRQTHARIELFNLYGQRVATLLDRDHAAGNYSLSLDGEGLAAGTYFVRLHTPNQSATQKVVLLK